MSLLHEESWSGKPVWKIECLKSENVIKFKDGEFLKFYEKHGIKRYFTARRTPLQSRMAERINRTISEIAKCIRLNVGLSKVFQTKAMCIACYILNWSRKAALDRKVAEDVWTRKKVPFFLNSLMRIFRYPAYVHILIWNDIKTLS